MSQYFVTYTTQSSINDVIFHSEVIRCKHPIHWIEKQNTFGDIKFSLIMFKEYSIVKFHCPIVVSYVSQQGIGDMLFKNETLIHKNPMTWILDKNKPTSKVKYALLKFWEYKPQGVFHGR